MIPQVCIDRDLDGNINRIGSMLLLKWTIYIIVKILYLKETIMEKYASVPYMFTTPIRYQSFFFRTHGFSYSRLHAIE